MWDVIIAHGPCHDGFTSSWVVWKSLSEGQRAQLEKLGSVFREREGKRRGGPRPYPKVTSVDGALALRQGTTEEVLGKALECPDVLFLMVPPQTAIPGEIVAGRRVLVVDLDLGSELRPVVEAAAHVRVLDHHKSGAQYVAACRTDFPDSRFSDNFQTAATESGASLTWAEFFPDEPVPHLVRTVQINDTWNFAQDAACDQKAVKLALEVRDVFSTFPALDAAVREWEAAGTAHTAVLEREGLTYARYQQHIVSSVAARGEVLYVVADVPGVGPRWYRGLGVNGCIFGSEVGHTLREETAPAFEETGVRIDFTFQWNYKPSDEIVVISLRGPGPNVDLSTLAPAISGPGKQKGGGHPKAAGFSIKDLSNFTKVFLSSPPSDIPEFQG